MLPYRLAAIDLDDTLLGPDKQISAANARAVDTLRDRGIRVVLASGRRHENMVRFHRQLDLEGPVVSCNGAQVRIAETDEILFEHPLSVELAGEVLEEGLRRNLTVSFYRRDGLCYVPEMTEWAELYMRRTGTRIAVEPDMRRFLGEQPLKILWIDAPERIAALQTEMRAYYGERLYIMTTDPEYLEFMAAGVDKAVGVAAVADHYAIPQNAVVTFGDGNNDVPMLRWAGLGVAMHNGRNSAKEAADVVSPPGNPETGFARAVDSLLASFA